MKLPIETPEFDKFTTAHAAACEIDGFCACAECMLPFLACLASDMSDHIKNDNEQPSTTPVDLLLQAAAMLFAGMKLKPHELGGVHPEMLFMKKCDEALTIAENNQASDARDIRPKVH